MKKAVLFLTALFIFGCQNSGIEKPDNLIKKDKMEDILFDISLLEALKTQNVNGGISLKESNDYIYKKYKIDSIQLSKSNKYYASDVAEYRNMYQKIKERLEQENKKLGVEKNDGINQNNTQNPDTTVVN